MGYFVIIRCRASCMGYFVIIRYRASCMGYFVIIGTGPLVWVTS